MRFLFLYPPGDKESLETDKKSSLFAPPLGVLYLGSSLEAQGHDVKVVDFRAEKITHEELKDHLLDVDVVGISVPTFAFKNALSLAKWVRKINSDVVLLIGGPHCSMYPEQTITSFDADYVVAGEGENAIVYLAELLEGKHDLSEIPTGVFYRKNGEIVGREPPQIIKDLDSLPLPARHLVSEYDYGNLFGFKPFKGKFTAMITSRGCPRQCRFCSRKLFSVGKYRQRSAENVVNEFHKVYDEGYDGVIVVDDNFLADKQRVHAIMDSLIDADIDVTILVEGARVDSAERELYRKMWDAGVRLLSFGIESGNQDVLDFYQKGITLDQVRDAVEMAHDTGFFTSGTFILGAPMENEEYFQNTIDFACSLPLDFAEFYVLEYRVGSDLWDEAVANGTINENHFLVKSCKENNLSAFTLSELRYWQKKAYKKFYLRWGYLFNQAQRLVMKQDLRLLRGGLTLLRRTTK